MPSPSTRLPAAAPVMGLLACFAALKQGLPGRIAPAPPGPSAAEEESKHARQSQLVENGPMLVSLLSSAQQEELASAFRQFDLDASGSM